jgi:hypothetical protein
MLEKSGSNTEFRINCANDTAPLAAVVNIKTEEYLTVVRKRTGIGVKLLYLVVQLLGFCWD